MLASLRVYLMLSNREYIDLIAKSTYFSQGCRDATDAGGVRWKKPWMWTDESWALYLMGARETKRIFGEPEVP